MCAEYSTLKSLEDFAELAAAHVRGIYASLGSFLIDGADHHNMPEIPGPLRQKDLKKIAQICGVTETSFIGMGFDRGGLFKNSDDMLYILLSGKGVTPATCMALAHEIGHAYLLNGVHGNRLAQYDQNFEQILSNIQAKEKFCWLFARSLLLPIVSAQRVFSQAKYTVDPSQWLSNLEAVRRNWNISAYAALKVANRVKAYPSNILAIVLRKRPHSTKGNNVQIRIDNYFPVPAQHWYLPRNQRATSAGLKGAIQLWEYWEKYPNKNHNKFNRSSGVFGINSIDSEGQVMVNENSVSNPIIEELFVWYKKNQQSKWEKLPKSALVAYRLYASDLLSAYCIAIVSFKQCDS